MAKDWLDQSNPQARAQARLLVSQLKQLGARNGEEWVASEIQEDIPQVARFLVLRNLWEEVANWRDITPQIIQAYIVEAQEEPDAPFADAGLAMKSMLDKGVTRTEIGSLARMAAYEAIFATLMVIDEGRDLEAKGDLPGWVLCETDHEENLTGRRIESLHESIQSLDPSGREGRPT